MSCLDLWDVPSMSCSDLWVVPSMSCPPSMSRPVDELSRSMNSLVDEMSDVRRWVVRRRVVSSMNLRRWGVSKSKLSSMHSSKRATFNSVLQFVPIKSTDFLKLSNQGHRTECWRDKMVISDFAFCHIVHSSYYVAVSTLLPYRSNFKRATRIPMIFNATCQLVLEITWHWTIGQNNFTGLEISTNRIVTISPINLIDSVDSMLSEL